MDPRQSVGADDTRTVIRRACVDCGAQLVTALRVDRPGFATVEAETGKPHACPRRRPRRELRPPIVVPPSVASAERLERSMAHLERTAARIAAAMADLRESVEIRRADRLSREGAA